MKLKFIKITICIVALFTIFANANIQTYANIEHSSSRITKSIITPHNLTTRSYDSQLARYYFSKYQTKEQALIKEAGISSKTGTTIVAQLDDELWENLKNGVPGDYKVVFLDGTTSLDYHFYVVSPFALTLHGVSFDPYGTVDASIDAHPLVITASYAKQHFTSAENIMKLSQRKLVVNGTEIPMANYTEGQGRDYYFKDENKLVVSSAKMLQRIQDYANSVTSISDPMRFEIAGYYSSSLAKVIIVPNNYTISNNYAIAMTANAIELTEQEARNLVDSQTLLEKLNAHYYTSNTNGLPNISVDDFNTIKTANAGDTIEVTLYQEHSPNDLTKPYGSKVTATHKVVIKISKNSSTDSNDKTTIFSSRGAIISSSKQKEQLKANLEKTLLDAFAAKLEVNGITQTNSIRITKVQQVETIANTRNSTNLLEDIKAGISGRYLVTLDNGISDTDPAYVSRTEILHIRDEHSGTQEIFQIGGNNFTIQATEVERMNSQTILSLSNAIAKNYNTNNIISNIDVISTSLKAKKGIYPVQLAITDDTSKQVSATIYVTVIDDKNHIQTEITTPTIDNSINSEFKNTKKEEIKSTKIPSTGDYLNIVSLLGTLFISGICLFVYKFKQ